MTVAERAVDLKAFYCRPCVLHDRVTVRYSDTTPTMPCPHAGDERHQCKRIEWVEKNWFCVKCHRAGRTSILYGSDTAGRSCEYGHEGYWDQTDESHFVFRSLPPLLGKSR